MRSARRSIGQDRRNGSGRHQEATDRRKASPEQILLDTHLRELSLVPVPEFRFHPERKWRFDLALPERMVGIEVHGGIWRRGGGAHTGTGHLRDMEKMNHAQALGWTVFQFSTDQVKNGEAKEFLRKALLT